MSAEQWTTIVSVVAVGGFLWQRTADLKSSMRREIDAVNKRIDDAVAALNKRIDDLRDTLRGAGKP